MRNGILEELTASQSGMAVCWLGNLSWLICAEGQLIAFDLDLDLDLRLQPSPVLATAIAQSLDVLFITHEHGDHLNATTGAVLAPESRCRFVVPANCEAKARTIGVPGERLCIARPRVPFDLPGIHVEPLRALHGDRHQAVTRHANLDDCGYVLTMGDQRLLQPGDSVLLQEQLELTDIDILFVSPTEHNMAIRPAATLIDALAPQHIFPQHFGTYRQTEDNRYWTAGFPDELAAALPGTLRDRYHKLRQGEVFRLPS